MLHKVISGLSVKEAVRTSVLSSAWRERWTYHSNLCFEWRNPELILRYGGQGRLAGHVTRVLQRLISSSSRSMSGVVVERFVFRSPVLVAHHIHLDRWLLGFVAGAIKAKHVTLDLTPVLLSERDADTLAATAKDRYRLPDSQVISSGGGGIVESLHLAHVCLELPPPAPAAASSVGVSLLRSLKKLELHLIDDRLGHLTTFLANCPALEWLDIHGCLLTEHFVVPQQARCLRYLRLYTCPAVQTIQLNVTSLTKFEYKGCAPRIETAGAGAGAGTGAGADALKLLSQAKLSFYTINLFDGVGYFWDQLSAYLSHARHLVLGLGTMDTKVSIYIYIS